MTKIVTHYWAKPIPLRNYDWEAYDDSTYDGPGSAVGYGATKEDAITDLTEQLIDRGVLSGRESDLDGPKNEMGNSDERRQVHR